jgi:hypothetical protein
MGNREAGAEVFSANCGGKLKVVSLVCVSSAASNLLPSIFPSPSYASMTEYLDRTTCICEILLCFGSACMRRCGRFCGKPSRPLSDIHASASFGARISGNNSRRQRRAGRDHRYKIERKGRLYTPFSLHKFPSIHSKLSATSYESCPLSVCGLKEDA